MHLYVTAHRTSGWQDKHVAQYHDWNSPVQKKMEIIQAVHNYYVQIFAYSQTFLNHQTNAKAYDVEDIWCIILMTLMSFLNT